jgi:hypothetical protein
VSEDPIGFAGGDANLGRYVGNFATGAVDWSGLYLDGGDASISELGRIRTPADSRGTWIEGAKGHGVFEFTDTPLNRSKGIVGLRVRFEGGYIGIGGFPESYYYGGSVSAATVEIERVTGTESDDFAADREMRKRLGNENWQRPKNYTWNHAGKPGSCTMELVDREVHMRVAHKGNASAVRGRVGVTVSALGIINVYMAVRDMPELLLEAGVPGVGCEADHFDYYFSEEDGSVFIVQPGIFYGGTKRYIGGPKAGGAESISSLQINEYRSVGDSIWGRFDERNQKFIPGIQRDRIEAVDPWSEQVHGWYDKDGYHEYPDWQKRHKYGWNPWDSIG